MDQRRTETAVFTFNVNNMCDQQPKVDSDTTKRKSSNSSSLLVHPRSGQMKGKKNKNLFIKLESDETIADRHEQKEQEEEDTDNQDDEHEDPQPVHYRKLFRFSDKYEYSLLAIGLLVAWIAGACRPLTIIFLGRLTNAFVQYGTLSTINKCLNGTTNVTMEDIIMLSQNDTRIKVIGDDDLLYEIKHYAVGLIAVGILQLAFNYIMITCLNWSAERQAFRIRDLFLRSILRQDIAWYDAHRTGEFASRTSDDLAKLQDGIGEKIGMFNYFVSNFVFSITNAFIHGWKLTLVILCIMPIVMVTMAILSKVQTKFSKKEMQAYARAGSVVEEAFTAIRTVVAFGGEAKEVDRYSKNLKSAKDTGIQKGLVVSLSGAMLWFLIYASYALAFWYGIKLILEDRHQLNPTYDPSTFIVVFFSVLTGSMTMGHSITYLDAFSQAKAAAGTIFSIIDRIPYIDSLSGRGLKRDNVDGCIQFDNVVFDYPSRHQVRILDGLDLKVESGETIAIIGESGCGKSTVVQLIQRFYDPVAGVIKFDNCDIKLLNVGWLREHIGVVSQEPILFGTTIAENIRYGLERATQKEIEKAAKMANAHDFIIKLPKKYQTQVGDRGTQLSGGQKQRVAIARALVKNPRILLLDEATSALDSESEGVIQEALDKARQGRTTIIIAHRLSTIRNANKIAVLSKGRVAELGTHDQLMANEGIYCQMVNIQNGKEAIEEQMASMNGNVTANGSQADCPKDPDASLPPVEFTPRSGSLLTKRKRKPRMVSEDQPTSSVLKVLKYNEPEWLYNLMGCIGSLIMAFNMPAFALIFGEIMGVLSDCNPDDIRRRSVFYSYLFLAVGIVIATATFLQIFMFSVAGQYLTQRLRRMLFTSMLKQDMVWFDDQQNNIGALCTRLSSDTASVHGVAGPRIGIILQSIGTISASIIVSMLLCWKLSLVSMVFVPIVLTAAYINSKIIRGQSVLEIESLDKANKIAIEAISNIRTVASLHRERTIHTLYMDKLEKPHKSVMRRSHLRGIVFGVAQSIPYFAYATCLFYGGYMIVHESLPYATVFKVAELLIMGTMIVGDAFSFAPNYTRGMVAAGRIFNLIERVSLIDPSSTDGEKLAEDKPASIQFKNVKFTYPSRLDTQILRGLELTIPHGKITALVGSSGCGKSTCIQLLERFYDPTSGSVTLDDKDISKLNIKWLRSQIGIVSQEPTLFNRTIAENIAYGDNNRTPSLQEIVQAAISANAHRFVSALPLGYETRVGDKGTQLSGGQKQRIAIARALLRNPKILLLDEATSALDSESEKLVKDALEEAQKGRTCITVAHRLSTIKDADLIAVIHKGLIVEIGTHDQLIELNGHYHKYYQMQIGQT